MVERIIKFLFRNKVVLFIDKQTAKDMDGFMYSVGEHWAAGAEIKQVPESDERISRNIMRPIRKKLYGKEYIRQA